LLLSAKNFGSIDIYQCANNQSNTELEPKENFLPEKPHTGRSGNASFGSECTQTRLFDYYCPEVLTTNKTQTRPHAKQPQFEHVDPARCLLQLQFARTVLARWSESEGNRTA
jgi:hypothetical protein